jgi:hypothetical protein
LGRQSISTTNLDGTSSWFARLCVEQRKDCPYHFAVFKPTLALLFSLIFRHLPCSTKGTGFPVQDLCKLAVNAWMAEKKDYKIKSFFDTGHYTQVVWKETTQVGCGAAIADARFYLTCAYYPRGNVQDMYTQNV